MKAVQDFNYKVALASGLKHLQAGRLRQAEEQFAYLVKRFPNADGGYRGLARVRMQLGDRTTAIATLRDGAAALAKAGTRDVAIGLLRECVSLDPLDLASHRRLAAALALADGVSDAAEEYVRYANEELAAGNEQRARLEAEYALETFGEIPALHDLAVRLGLPLRTVGGVEALGGAAPGDVASEADQASSGSAAPADVQPSSTSLGAAPSSSFVVADLPAPGSREVQHEEAPQPADPLALEARAMALIGSHDPEAGAAAIEATRALAASGRVQAASDLLLELVASGIAVHEAERELVAVARAIGRADLADERERLLGEAAQLG